jgi:hypothetical protein
MAKNESRLSDEAAKVGEAIDHRAQHYGLTRAELEASGRRRDAREPIPVDAWIPHRVVYEDPQRVPGVVVAWTDRAVLVRWRSLHGAAVWETWVRADAVERRDGRL